MKTIRATIQAIEVNTGKEVTLELEDPNMKTYRGMILILNTNGKAIEYTKEIAIEELEANIYKKTIIEELQDKLTDPIIYNKFLTLQ